MNQQSSKPRKRIELHLSRKNLVLDVKNIEQKTPLREKIEADYLKKLELRTNQSTKLPNPSPSHRRFQSYDQV